MAVCWDVILLRFITLKMEAARSFEMSFSIYQAIRRYILDDGRLHMRAENVRFHDKSGNRTPK
jgi:hypothetical protein